jgi:hypothetical protein
MACADALPEYHHREQHGVRVDAPPERALRAVREVTAREAPLLRFLFRLRGLPAGGERPLLDQLVEGAGFSARGDGTWTAVGRPWRVREGLRRVEDFDAFAEPGWAKLVLDFTAADGRLATETRVYLTDARARRRFRLYWLAVRPFSGLVRRSWLKAARRRAED